MVRTSLMCGKCGIAGCDLVPQLCGKDPTGGLVIRHIVEQTDDGFVPVVEVDGKAIYRDWETK